MKLCPVILCAALAISVHGQSPTPSAAATAKQNISSSATPVKPEIASLKLEFREEPPLPGISVSPVVVLPAQCTSDGLLYLEMLRPPEFRDRYVSSFTDKKGTAFALSSINDLNNVEEIGMFPSSTSLGFLVRAVKNEGISQGSSATAKPADYAFYIAQFKLDGTYDHATELQFKNLTPFHFGILPSGEFIIAGFDHVNSITKVLILNAGGTGIRSIPIPDSIAEPKAVMDPYSVEGVQTAGRIASSVLLTAYRDKVLAWRMDTLAPILEIGPGGSVREIPLQMPQGCLLAGVAPSTTSLLLHLHPKAQTGEEQANTSTVYYLASAIDGALLKKLSLSGNAPSMIACENSGIYMSYRTDEKGNLSRLIAR